MIAADLKLTLMERYPDDFNVKIITGSHSDGAHVIECPLYEIDRYDDYFNNLTSLFIPKSMRIHYFIKILITQFKLLIYSLIMKKGVRGIKYKLTTH